MSTFATILAITSMLCITALAVFFITDDDPRNVRLGIAIVLFYIILCVKWVVQKKDIY